MGPRVRRPGPAEFLQQGSQGEVVSAGSLVQQPHGERLSRRVRHNAGIAGEHRLDQRPRSFRTAQAGRQGRRQARLRPVDSQIPLSKRPDGSGAIPTPHKADHRNE